ncbi:hypothetical protein [uncultured Williamsia sp.]|uniref:NucA/NucB deoxyribonuclease domain-containing protein n=1 Tax=uncultured Williamsia sp. TaxID=259311 RepID=UPI002636BFE9|nr:hypothetical protein [uncultured Williamsia sp.]
MLTKPRGSVVRVFSQAVTYLLTVLFIAAAFGAAPASADRYGNYDVVGRILDEYRIQGGPAKLGNPTMNEANAAVANSKYQNFANDSAIYWNANVANGYAKMVRGAIRAKWAQFNYERGPFGFPTISEAALGKNNGSYNTFQGGSIYYSPNTGAHQVWGALRDLWGKSGYENGNLGYPVTDEYELRGGYQQQFEGGYLNWNVGPVVDANPDDSDPVIGKDDPYNKYPSRFSLALSPTGSKCNTSSNGVEMCLGFGDEEFPTDNNTNARRAPAPSPSQSPETSVPSEPAPSSEPSSAPAPSSDSPTAEPPSTSSPAPTSESSSTPAPTSASPTPQLQNSPTTSSVAPAISTKTPPHIRLVDDPADEPTDDFPIPDDPAPDTAAESDFFGSGNALCNNGPATGEFHGKRFLVCAKERAKLRIRQLDVVTGQVKTIGWAKGWVYLSVATLNNSPTASVRVKAIGKTFTGVGRSTVLESSFGNLLPSDNHEITNTAGTAKGNFFDGFPNVRYDIKAKGLENTPGTLSVISEILNMRASNPEPLTAAATRGFRLPDWRCDSLTYFKGVGCVIREDANSQNLPVLDMTTTKNNDTLLYDHILRSQNSLVPGNPIIKNFLGKLSKLTRITEGDSQYGKNRSTACPRWFPTRFTPPSGTTCDEYPFASTREGAGKYANPVGRTFYFCGIPYQYLPNGDTFQNPAGYSSCYIPAKQNSAGGGILPSFYRFNRILAYGEDTDGFLVSAYH